MEEVPETPEATALVALSREAIGRILHGHDDRLLVVVGPCSIHDPGAGLEYAHRLREKAVPFGEDLFVVMRVYFEKPRTTVGWKGLINDPRLDGSFAINEGLRLARRFLADLAALGLPSGHGVPRSHHPPVPRRLRLLGGDRRPHLREPGAPGAGLRPQHAGGIQERDGRRDEGGDRGDRQRLPPPPLPERHQAGRGRDRGHPRQPRLPPHPARGHPRAELRARVGGGRGRGASRRLAASPADGRLQPRQQRQGPRAAGRGGLGGGAPAWPTATPPSPA